MPIVVVVGLVVVALSVRFRTQIGSGFKRLFNNRVVAPATTTARASDGPRELTAAEMTGTPAPAVTTRRPRRNRRTPSQMSTTSLPVYAKEAGDHELVIIQ